jgi:hypothetical protein
MWLDDGESVHREIVSKGKVLYEKSDMGLGAQSRSRSRHRGKTVPKQSSVS